MNFKKSLIIISTIGLSAVILGGCSLQSKSSVSNQPKETATSKPEFVSPAGTVQNDQPVVTSVSPIPSSAVTSTNAIKEMDKEINKVPDSEYNDTILNDKELSL